MAISKVADRATVNDNAAGTTFDYVLSGLTVGNVLIIRTAADNSGGGGAARTITVTNQSGTPIDTATDQAFQQNNDPGSASAGITCNVVVAAITATSGTVRITYSGSVVQAGVAEEWTGLNAGSPVVGTPVGANGTTTNLASCADASVASGNLAYGAMAVEGPQSDTYTQDADTTNGSWSNLTKAGTSNATADQNCTTYGGYKVVSGTAGQTYNPTIGTNRDSAGIILELAATVTVEATLAAPLGSLTAAATATPEHPATLDAPLGSVTATASATVEHPASLDAPLGGLTATMDATVEAGAPTIEATMDAPLGALAGAASATVEHPATMDAPLGSLSAGATATPEHPATLAAQLGSLTAAASATVDHPATLTATLGGLSASLTATVEEGEEPPPEPEPQQVPGDSGGGFTFHAPPPHPRSFDDDDVLVALI